jgi:hypothetical protein
MKLEKKRMWPMTSPLVGFVGEMMQLAGSIALPVVVGSVPTQVIVMADFLIVNWPSTYNAIIGKTTLNKLIVVTSTYHLKMKFPTENGVGKSKGTRL